MIKRTYFIYFSRHSKQYPYLKTGEGFRTTAFKSLLGNPGHVLRTELSKLEKEFKDQTIIVERFNRV